MNLSIRWKVTLGALLSVTLGLVTAGWLVLQSIHRYELGRLTDDLAARTGLTAAALHPLLSAPSALPLRPDQTLQSRARDLSRQAVARITVIGPDGTVLADSATPDDQVGGLDNHGSRPEVLGALSSGQGTDIRTSRATGQRMFYLAQAIRDREGKPEAVVRLALPLTALDLRLQDLKRSMGVAFGIALAVGLALSIAIARGLSRPIAEMAKVARNLAAGALGQRLDATSGDEVGLLARTLNQIADQLETKIREISEDRAQLLAMLSAMVEGVMVLDGRGKVLQINPALERMFGIRAAEAKGRLHWEIIRHHKLNELATQVLASQRSRGGEIAMAPGGRSFRVEASVYGLQREDEANAVLVFHDITALRRLEKARKDFVANVSHELRTPLTSIKGYVEALLDGAQEDPSQRDRFLRIILTQTDRLNLILEDLLQLSQMESGEVRFRREPVPLQAMVDRTLLLMKPLAEKKDHALTVALPPTLPPVLGDEGRLVQVLTNLVDNAIKYTPEGGAIQIAGRTVPESGSGGAALVEVSVSDTGLGIPEADRPRVFERFYRVDKARSRELGGTGLGLAIVKHIVEGHGGRVWIEGRVPRGSKVVVQLPAAAQAESSNTTT